MNSSKKPRKTGVFHSVCYHFATIRPRGNYAASGGAGQDLRAHSDSKEGEAGAFLRTQDTRRRAVRPRYWVCFGTLVECLVVDFVGNIQCCVEGDGVLCVLFRCLECLKWSVHGPAPAVAAPIPPARVLGGVGRGLAK